jgi:hypothetical protein
MRINPTSIPAAGHARAIQSAQSTCRVAGHQSSPTTRPVESLGAIIDENSTRRPSRHTFDISV